MPKLNKQTAAAVTEAAENSDFEPMPAGRYIFKLVDVESKDGQRAPYWSWQYECNEEPYVGRKVWDNTSLSEKAAWRLGKVFAAFEVPADTDTDELIGREVALMIAQETAQAGKRQGQLVNVVTDVLPLTPEEKSYWEGEEVPEI